VRGDLIRIFAKLLEKRDKFDYVIVETTGMADPAPIAQVRPYLDLTQKCDVAHACFFHYVPLGPLRDVLHCIQDTNLHADILQ
jgi:hypothetical protein